MEGEKEKNPKKDRDRQKSRGPMWVYFCCYVTAFTTP